MSASSRPTSCPWSAMASARFTLTDDFPTPPLPDETAITRVRGAHHRWSRMFACMSTRLLHELCALALGHRPDFDHDIVDFRQCSHLANDIVFDLIAHRTRRDCQRNPDCGALVDDFDALDHAQLDNVAAELGVEYAAECFFDGFGDRHSHIVSWTVYEITLRR